MLASSSFVHTAPLSSAPPSVPSSLSSQSGAPAVAVGELTVPQDEGEPTVPQDEGEPTVPQDEGEPTVPQDGEGEKCVCCTV